ncbi:MAG: prefoldin subunit alpha [Desulfurococcales archaeon]|nr:prefoldin subunit alpha [Desulfurococcales archaeon]
MSGEQRGTMIDIGAVYAQMQALAEEINKLRAVEAQMVGSLESIKRAKDTIDEFVRLKEGTVLMPLDPQLNGFAYVSIAESDKFIVSLGLNYYAELDSAKALEVLSQKERALNGQLASLRETLKDYVNLYERYRQVLEALAAQAQRGTAQARK